MLNQRDLKLTKALLFGDPRNNITIDTLIMNTTDFILDTRRFGVPLFQHF